MNPPLPADYHERVYAGVLGKLIGVYLGRPFEQWSHEKIVARWGEDGRTILEADDPDAMLDGGGVGWRIATGRQESGPLQVKPTAAKLS